MTPETKARNNADWESFDDWTDLEGLPEEVVYCDGYDEDDDE